MDGWMDGEMKSSVPFIKLLPRSLAATINRSAHNCSPSPTSFKLKMSDRYGRPARRNAGQRSSVAQRSHCVPAAAAAAAAG